MSRLRGLFVLDPSAFEMVYGPDERADVERHVRIVGPRTGRHELEALGPILADVEVLLSGWGGPRLDERLLAAMPALRAVFYGGGSVAGVMTEAAWRRGIVVTSAWTANAVPVAEYALATILFSLKHGWRLARETRASARFPRRDAAPGCYGSTVGLISLGATARVLLGMLKPFDLRVRVYDPFLDDAEAAALGVGRASLDELFRQCDVVSLHAPELPETRGMIRGHHLASMRAGATFINTARPAIVRQDELIDVAARRPDVQFVLDVAEPEPPPPGSPLYTLANVVLTPHIAGSVGRECRRMGRYMADEVARFAAGEPLRWAITPEAAMRSSHRPIDMRAAPEPPATAPAPMPALAAAS